MKTGGQPAFKRLSNRLTGIKKKWYKAKVHRANRRRLRQAIDIETFKDKPLNERALD
jgi:hypothetical protein